MSAPWVAVVAAAALAATSLDLAAALARSAGTSSALTRRRVLRAVAFVRLTLVATAWVLAYALADVPFAAFAVLGAVPLVLGISTLRRRGTSHRVEVAGRPSSIVATLSLSGDDVATWIVLLRWHPGVATWPATLVLVLGAIAVPWIALRVGTRSSPQVARSWSAMAPIAQIATGVVLILICAVSAS